MKYAVSSWIYGGESLEHVFDRLARYGYDAVELEGEPDKYAVKEVLELSRRYCLSISGIAGMYPWPTEERDLASPDPEVRKRAVQYLHSCIEFAHDLAAPLVIVVPSAVGKTMPLPIFNGEKDISAWDETVEREWAYAQDSVGKCCEAAREKGIILAVEPINRYETFLINTCRQGLQFISSFGEKTVRLHLDTFHMNIEEINQKQAILEAGELLANLHVADSNRQAVGRGHIDFAGVVSSLKEINYAGVLSLEPLPPVPNPYVAMKLDRYKAMRDEIARESIETLKIIDAQ